jgi:response regulator of citrate/malate metabolism
LPDLLNPAHLYLGDAIANAADMMAAKRQRNPLKKAEVVQIVAFAKKGRSVDHLAEQFKVSAVAIRKILAGKTHAKTTGIVHVPKGPFGRPINQPMKEAA